MKDYFGYKNKVCVVTGVSSGMGKSTAKMLVDLGAKVYGLDINECELDGLEDFIDCNLSHKKDIDKAFKIIPKSIDITVKQVNIIAVTLVDSPSIPSVKLTAFVVASITNTANGT